MNNYSEFIRTLQEELDTKPELVETKKQAYEAAIASLKKDRWMEALYKLAPLLGPIGQVFMHHEHR